MTGADNDAGVLFAHYEELDWDGDDSGGSRLPPGRVSSARRAGVRRMTMSDGFAGFNVVHTEMPPNFVVRRHKHGHDEVFVVRRGSMLFDGREPLELSENDVAVIKANEYYGFTVGPEGIAFVVIRLGRTTYSSDNDESQDAESAAATVAS
jgi:mannose-6-phosphate isomerase-like protein (cupin superfamily)